MLTNGMRYAGSTTVFQEYGLRECGMGPRLRGDDVLGAAGVVSGNAGTDGA